MIVDDEESSRQAFEEVLREEFEVIAARDGFHALESLGKTEPDLLLLDVAMPLMDGFETCRKIRDNPAFQDLQILFLSAYDDPETVKKTYACGGNLFVKKPIEPERLVKNVKLSLQRVGPPKKKRFPIESLKSGGLRRGQPGLPSVETPGPTQKRRQAPVPTPAPASAAPQGQEPTEALLMPRLMVVDDDPEVVTLLELAFQEHYEVVSAQDGLEAIERVANCQPDILLIDIMMPKMNGFQLCQALRRTVPYRTAPILFLTAKSGRKDREYANRCGADAYILKPFDVKKLYELIESIVAKPTFRVRPKTLSLVELRKLEEAEAREKEDRRFMRHVQLQYDNLQDFIDRNL